MCRESNMTVLIFAALVMGCNQCRPYTLFPTVNFFTAVKCDAGCVTLGKCE